MTVLKSGSLNLLEPSQPVQACNGIALPLPLIFNKCGYDVTFNSEQMNKVQRLINSFESLIRGHVFWIMYIFSKQREYLKKKLNSKLSVNITISAPTGLYTQKSVTATEIFLACELIIFPLCCISRLVLNLHHSRSKTSLFAVSATVIQARYVFRQIISP